MAEKIIDRKIIEALELLDELARDKKDELQDLVTEKYGNLKSALAGYAEESQDQAHETFEKYDEKVTEFSSRIDESVHKNPWAYLGGTALGFLILGIRLGRPRK